MKLNLIKALYYFESAKRVANTFLLAVSHDNYYYRLPKEVRRDIDNAEKYNRETDKQLERIVEGI